MADLVAGVVLLVWVGCLAVVVPETRFRRPAAVARHVAGWVAHPDTRPLMHGAGAAGFAVLLPILFAWLFSGDTMRAARWASGWLELIGIAVTGYGLNRRRVQAGGRKLLAMLQSSLRLLFLGRQKGGGYSVAVDPARMTITGHPVVLKVEPSEEASNREWIDHLRTQLEEVRAEISAAEKRSADQLAKTRAGLESKLDHLGRALSDSEERSRELAVGDVPIEALGLVLIAAGVVFATWPGLVVGLWGAIPG